VNPFARGGLSPYLLGGVAVQVAAGATREYLLVGIGVEGAPGSTRGMFAELGVAGGVRLALGWRVRTRVRPRGAGG
jgi:hypothetical protein